MILRHFYTTTFKDRLMRKVFTCSVLRAALLVLLAMCSAASVWADEVSYYDPTAEDGSQMKTVG